MNKQFKFTFGDCVYTNSSPCSWEELIEAHYSPRAEKQEKLRKVNITLTKLRFYFQMDMKLYSRAHQLQYSKKIEELRRQMDKNVNSPKIR